MGDKLRGVGTLNQPLTLLYITMKETRWVCSSVVQGTRAIGESDRGAKLSFAAERVGRNSYKILRGRGVTSFDILAKIVLPPAGTLKKDRHLTDFSRNFAPSELTGSYIVG